MAPTFMTNLSTYLGLPKLASVQRADMLRIGARMIDPRGRCNRQAMTVLTVAFVLIQLVSMVLANAIGGDIGVAVFWIINAPILVVGLVAVVKRLHDIGLPGWWAPVAAALWIMTAFVAAVVLVLLLGPDRMTKAVEEGGALYWLVFSFVFVPAFGGFIWLHSTPGTSGANNFGPVPGNDGFGPGHGRSRSQNPPSDAITAA